MKQEGEKKNLGGSGGEFKLLTPSCQLAFLPQLACLPLSYFSSASGTGDHCVSKDSIGPGRLNRQWEDFLWEELCFGEGQAALGVAPWCSPT